MCPLVSAPNRGYADYQRIGNYDSGALFGASNQGVQVTLTSPVLDVSRFAFLAGYVTPVNTGMELFITWYSDSAQTLLVGSRQFMVDPNVGNRAQLHLINLGPFCVFQVLGTGNPNSVVGLELFATNRPHPLEFIPQQPVVISRVNQVAAAGATFWYPSDYFAGPAQVWYLPLGTNMFLALESLDTTLLWLVVGEWTGAAGVDINLQVVLPTGAWRARIQNNSGVANNFHLTITPSTTGAS